MILFLVAALPLALGLLLAGSQRQWQKLAPRPRRLGLALVASVIFATVVLLAAWDAPSARFAWGGGLALSLSLTPLAGLAALLVPAIAWPVTLWAAAQEDDDGLARLVGGLIAFVGAMELLVLAADLLTLIVGWELVGGLSWLLIAHRHQDDEATHSAAYAFNATRLGGLGLFVAAGASLASTGGFSFGALTTVAEGPHGDLFAAGVLVAAASKSAQVPFSPWLFRAMHGPSSVSALLHSSTMVAAGAWLLARLHGPLSLVWWFGHAAIAIGLVTALAGGIVAATQRHAKRLLAASTSAQYGLMFAAAGAGASGALSAHLVTHAALKALLFLAAGAALGVAGSGWLGAMRLGRVLPFTAAASAIGALSLAAVPPLGAAWSKEQVVAATGRVSPALALLTIAAGAFSAFYALRFQLLAFGRAQKTEHDSGASGQVALGLLAAACLGLSALWLPAVHQAAASWLGASLPKGKTWELVTSNLAVLAALAAGLALHRHCPAAHEHTRRIPRLVAGWLGLPVAIDRALVRPTLALAAALSRFDDRIVDAGVRSSALALATALSHFDNRIVDAGVRGCAAFARALSRGASGLLESGAHGALELLRELTLGAGRAARWGDERGVDAGLEKAARGIGHGGQRARQLQSGALPTYYTYAVTGLFVLALAFWLWSLG